MWVEDLPLQTPQDKVWVAMDVSAFNASGGRVAARTIPNSHASSSHLHHIAKDMNGNNAKRRGILNGKWRSLPVHDQIHEKKRICMQI